MSAKSLNLLLACVAAAGLAACDIDVEDDGELPKVDVEGGRAPEVEIRGPDVDVGTQEKTITLPDVDVDVPDEDENEPNLPEDPDADDNDPAHP
jgi:hypothetical protein